MAALPGGIVTFLFTDIEGSTRLWEHEPDLMWAAVARHNELLDAAISEHRGFHFKTIGDAFQAAFASPVDALHAVVDAQKRFAAESWEGIGPIRVRMALHCGPAHPVEGDYLAPCLNRLSRMMSTGYGGQVLLSSLIRRRVESALPEGVSLRDLGSHRLRDLLEPERITQAVIEGVPSSFPPLKSLERHPTNLPIQPNPLVGRTNEIQEVTELLRDETVRLVTLTGIGGTGKTRLALQVAAEMIDEFQDGVYFVDLAPLSDAESVIPEIMTTLGIPETDGSSLHETLVSSLRDEHLLLILDNFEHVLEAAVDVAALLERCPKVSIIVTSRAALHLRAEYVRPVSPLETPNPRRSPSLSELAKHDAVSLFVQRASMADASFALTAANAPVIAAICNHLDGIPLALELAAARIRTIPPESLLERLDRRLDLLTMGARDLPARHRTLRATIEWSYSLLTPQAQALFTTLAVFAGGFDLSAVARILALLGLLEDDPLDGVTALVDCSLVRRADTARGEIRYSMLETLREFGLEQLRRSGDLDQVQDAHAVWCLGLTQQADSMLTGPEQSVWLDRLELEHDNVRAALSWSDANGDHPKQVALASSLVRFWMIRGHLNEGRRWLDEALQTFAASPTSYVQIGAMIGAGHLAYAQGAFGVASDRYQVALEAARVMSHREYEAILLNALGNIEFAAGNLDQANRLYTESVELSESIDDPHHRANALGNLGAVAHFRGETQVAMARYHECLKLWHTLGNTEGTLVMLQNLLILLAPFPEHASRAHVYGEECLRLSRTLGDQRSEALTLTGLAIVAHVEGNLTMARELHQRSLDLYTALNDQDGVGRAVSNLGLVAIDAGDLSGARDLLLRSLALNRELEVTDGVATALEGLAAVANDESHPELAARLIGAAAGLRLDMKVAIPGEMQQQHTRVVTELKARLGARFALERQRGETMTLDDLIADVRSPNIPGEREHGPGNAVEITLREIDTLLPDGLERPLRAESLT
jgi:predicted ATPase/class 3 adenylate cyclase/Flp pilus assembly protein TadD